MQSTDALRTLLAQARLHVRRAQHCIDNEPRLRGIASDECDKACALVDHVLAKLGDGGQDGAA